MADVVSPAELKRLAEEKELQKMKEALDQKKKKEEAERHVHDAFFSEEIAPDAIARLNTQIRRAAEQGQSEVLVAKFPATYCTDHGRAINNFEADWHNTLQGKGKRAYDYFKEQLEPQGYKVRAQILDYPDGNLGDVGFFLRW